MREQRFVKIIDPTADHYGQWSCDMCGVFYENPPVPNPILIEHRNIFHHGNVSLCLCRVCFNNLVSACSQWLSDHDQDHPVIEAREPAREKPALPLLGCEKVYEQDYENTPDGLRVKGTTYMTDAHIKGGKSSFTPNRSAYAFLVLETLCSDVREIAHYLREAKHE